MACVSDNVGDHGVVFARGVALTVHTFPEHGSLCLNLFCCRPRPEWDFAGRLGELFGASDVTVRQTERNYAGDASASARP